MNKSDTNYKTINCNNSDIIPLKNIGNIIDKYKHNNIFLNKETWDFTSCEIRLLTTMAMFSTFILFPIIIRLLFGMIGFAGGYELYYKYSDKKPLN